MEKNPYLRRPQLLLFARTTERKPYCFIPGLYIWKFSFLWPFWPIILLLRLGALWSFRYIFKAHDRLFLVLPGFWTGSPSFAVVLCVCVFSAYQNWFVAMGISDNTRAQESKKMEKKNRRNWKRKTRKWSGRFKTLKQEESLQDYLRQFNILVSCLILTNEYQINLYITGVKAEARALIWAHHPTSLQQAYSVTSRDENN